MITFCFGTRPEIIKMAPVIWEFKRRGLPFRTVHSGQHFDYRMSEQFLEEMTLPKPNENLNVRSFPDMLSNFTYCFQGTEPTCVVVQGDTNTTLAAGLAAAKLKIPVCHIEAGLRSGDMDMPEELNRILVDNLSAWRYAPTNRARENLQYEGLGSLLVGNTIVDVVERFRPTRGEKKHILVTMHREENTNSPDTLRSLIIMMHKIWKRTKIPFIFPMHPRTFNVMANIEAKFHEEGINFTAPLGYTNFLTAEAEAHCIVTDSGGVQEEACILGVPCLTIRDSTERQETLGIGANRLVSIRNLDLNVKVVMEKEATWEHPYGKDVGKAIADHLEDYYV